MVTSNPKASQGLIPVGRFGTADEVAEVSVMLARNGYITGQTINVNGGWYHELKTLSEQDRLLFPRPLIKPLEMLGCKSYMYMKKGIKRDSK